jgi:hypothetical protein
VALANYNDLVSAIGDWLARTDLADNAPDFILLAEARFQRELRVRQMLSQETGTVSTQVLALPSDFIEVHRLTLDTENDVPLEYRPLEDSELRVAGVTSGQPKWWTILGTNIRFYPAPDGTYSYTLDYYAKVPALNPGNTTNWLLTNAPDVYLFSALSEAEPFLQNDDRIALWKSKADMAIRSLNQSDMRSKRSNAPRRMRVVS